MKSAIRHEVIDSHPSISASMEDFEAPVFSPTFRDDLQHSEHGSNYSDSSPAMSSRREASPPAWRKAGSGWFKHPPLLAPNVSTCEKEVSPEYHSADEDGVGSSQEDAVLYPSPAKIPLPESPIHGRSPSPTPEPYADAHATPTNMQKMNPFRATPPVLLPEEELGSETPRQANYIRFTTSLDVIQRTEPIEATITWIRTMVSHITTSRLSMLQYALLGLVTTWLLTALTKSPETGMIPDMVKVAKMAESFVPSIYYSKHGTAQIAELHDTGLAVWDLGESVRSSNMTSAPIIVRQLDELSDSLKDLAIQLTSFFSSLDYDIDLILNAMEWAARELEGISSVSSSSTLSTIWSNTHNMLTGFGTIAENKLVRGLLGRTSAQRSKATLDRTFNEFLGVIEESINNELTWSVRLFGMLEGIDGQFQNLRRSTVREEDQQERLESDFLSSLWTKAIGGNAHRLRKFQKNRELLASINERTNDNKQHLTSHKVRLLRLKSNLELLRRRLVTPQIHNSNTSQSIEQQLSGLHGVYHTLKGARDERRQAIMQRTFGASNTGSQNIEAG